MKAFGTFCMTVCPNDTQKVSLPIRDLEVLEEAYS